MKSSRVTLDPSKLLGYRLEYRARSARTEGLTAKTGPKIGEAKRLAIASPEDAPALSARTGSKIGGVKVH